MAAAPLVLVHGNPETPAVWDPLMGVLDRTDAFRLSPPGFGAPLPASFDATTTGYRDWLVTCLESFTEPVDLVGHDWGGLHVLNVAMTRPDLLRSWVSDAAGVYDPGYSWHPLAQVWQRPVEGEAWVQAAFTAPLHQRVDAMRELLGADESGAPEAGRTAKRLAAGQDEQMGRAVLSLYRSAAQPTMARAGRAMAAAAARPGLVIDATEDATTGSAEARARMAAAAGASTAHLKGLGHWWMVQDARQAAGALTRFWTSLP